jgi:transposase
VISAQQKAEVRRLYYGERWKVGTIATALGLHHATVAAALSDKPRGAFARPGQLDGYTSLVHEVLQQHPRLCATRVHEMLRVRGYKGSVYTVRRLVRRLRPRPSAAYLRMTVLSGEQAQADWGHFGRVRIGRGERLLSAFVMVLSWSRALHVVFTLDQTMESFLRGHLLAFEAFAGVPRQILYDNLKSAVLSRHGSAIQFHPQLLELSGHYHFTPHPCAPFRANEKGRVERQIHYLRHSFFAARSFTDVDDLNAQFLRWRDELAHARPHPEQPDLSVADMLVQERSCLIPLPEKPLPCQTVVHVSARKTPYVVFDRNSYSIPHTLIGRNLTLIADHQRVRILDRLDQIADHPRCWDTKTVIEDPAHIADLVRERRRAAGSTAKSRLCRAVPSAESLLQLLAQRGEHIAHHTARLVRLHDDYGPASLHSAITEAIANGALGAGSVAHILERNRRRAGLRPPLHIPLPEHPGVLDAEVSTHNLEDYDEPHDDRDDDPQR